MTSILLTLLVILVLSAFAIIGAIISTLDAPKGEKWHWSMYGRPSLRRESSQPLRRKGKVTRPWSDWTTEDLDKKRMNPYDTVQISENSRTGWITRGQKPLKQADVDAIKAELKKRGEL